MTNRGGGGGRGVKIQGQDSEYSGYRELWILQIIIVGSPASAFRHRGVKSGTAGHGLIRCYLAMLGYTLHICHHRYCKLIPQEGTSDGITIFNISIAIELYK